VFDETRSVLLQFTEKIATSVTERKRMMNFMGMFSYVVPEKLTIPISTSKTIAYNVWQNNAAPLVAYSMDQLRVSRRKRG
jgi:hypothetical protein